MFLCWDPCRLRSARSTSTRSKARADGQRALTKEELVERRIVQDWVARPLLRSIPGVAEINSTGGYVKQYQVLVDPYRLRYYHVTIHDVQEALARNNANSSGGILPRGPGDSIWFAVLA